MNNYIKSEIYRFNNKKTYRNTAIVLLSLVVLVAMGIVFSNIKYTVKEPLTSLVFFGIVMSQDTFMYVAAVIIADILLGKDIGVVKASINSGITRERIFKDKFKISLISFTILEILIIIVSFIIGVVLIGNFNINDFKLYLVSLVNMFPIKISVLAIAHVLGIFGNRFALLFILVIYEFLGAILSAASSLNIIIEKIYNISPKGISDTIKANFVKEEIIFMPRAWLVGIGIFSIVFFIGYSKYKKKDF
ncbi:MAG: hypothetical protein WAO56_05660 [Miniphocaeibacter sp.]|uniref:hypothetical protein n=1 Tax=Miniphocaeibacter sp. TaxID=3100973 RepID=UPI0017ABDE82|nr:hypothetical protein [Gallicola sp.]